MKRIVILSLLASLAVFCFVLSNTLHADIVGVWLFDEGNGNEVKDASGNGYDGEIVGNVDWADGKFEKALKLDGGHVRIPHQDSMDLEQFTITAWIKVPKVVDPYQMIVGKEAWPDRNYSMWIRPDVMTFGFTTPGAAQDIQLGSNSVIDDKWHFVVGVYDKKSLIAYVDGIPVGNRGAAADPATNTAPLMIGAQPPAGGGPLLGLIDEVAIYDTALEEKEILDIMEGLTNIFQAVDAKGKLTTTWAKIKSD